MAKGSNAAFMKMIAAKKAKKGAKVAKKPAKKMAPKGKKGY